MYKCPICESTTISKLEDRGKYRILCCNKCKLRFSEPMREGGKEYYHRRSYQVRSPEKDWRYKSLFSLISLDKGQKVLDIGCGRGDFLSIVKERGAKPFGIDIDKEAITQAKNRLEVDEIHIDQIGYLYGYRFIEAIEVLSFFPSYA